MCVPYMACFLTTLYGMLYCEYTLYGMFPMTSLYGMLYCEYTLYGMFPMTSLYGMLYCEYTLYGYVFLLVWHTCMLCTGYDLPSSLMCNVLSADISVPAMLSIFTLT